MSETQLGKIAHYLGNLAEMLKAIDEAPKHGAEPVSLTIVDTWGHELTRVAILLPAAVAARLEEKEEAEDDA